MEISAICRRDRISKQNEVAIIIRLYHNGIVRKITSGLRIKVDYWDFDNNCLKNGIPNQEHLQYLLDKQIQEFKKRELEYKIQGKNYSIDDIIGIKKKPAMTVEEYFQKIINELYNSIVFPKSCNVIPEYNRSLLSVGYKVQNDSATFNIPYV